MKNCPYCGRGNDGEAAYCAGCGTELVVAPAPEEQPLVDSAVAIASNPSAADSARAWTASDAWKCLGMIFIFEVLLGLWSSGLSGRIPPFRHWLHTGLGHFTFALVDYIIEIGIVLYFSRTESWDSFLKAFGLDSPPSSYVWFAVTATLAIRGFEQVMFSSHLAHGVVTTSRLGFAHTVGPQRFLFLATPLLAPFFEELYMRGFFYRAFRGSYSAVFSTGLILGITALTHWGQFRQSWIAVVDISVMSVLQCFLRERGNLRDAMICHFVFNASAAVINSVAYL